MSIRRAGTMRVNVGASWPAAALAMPTAIAASSVSAIPRTFAASTGADSRPCARSQPCRGFAAALALRDAGGEIAVLDSTGYGPVTIDNSVSIVAPPGVYAGISIIGIVSSRSGSDVRATGSGISRKTTGIGPKAGAVLNSPTSNDVHDNATDDGGHTPDSRL